MAVRLLKIALKATGCGVVVSMFLTGLVGGLWAFCQKMDEGKIGAIVPEDYRWSVNAAMVMGFLLGFVVVLCYEAGLHKDLEEIWEEMNEKKSKS